MSAIQKAICKLLDIDPKRGEDRQDFLKRCVKGVNELTDADFEKLDGDLLTWFNAAADVIDANKKASKKAPLPDFPDVEEAKDEEEAPRRRGAIKGEDKKADSAIKLGTEVTVIKKNGREVTGILVERDKDVLVLKVDGKEREVEMDDVGSIEQVNGAGKGSDEPEGPAEPKVGDTVKIKTKRGREVEGKVTELDDNTIVLETDDGSEDFTRERLDSIKVVGGTKGKKDEPREETSSRRRASEDEGKGGKKEETKTKRVDNGGVSIGQRIKELIADNLDAGEDTIAKLLKKEDLDFRENTLKLNFVDCHKFLDVLKARKLLKA